MVMLRTNSPLFDYFMVWLGLFNFSESIANWSAVCKQPDSNTIRWQVVIDIHITRPNMSKSTLIGINMQIELLEASSKILMSIA